MTRLAQSGRSLSAAMRISARHTLIKTLHGIGAFERARQRVVSNNAVVVLTLHRIVPDAEVARCRSPQGMVLCESLFVRLLDYLQEYAEVISPAQLTLPAERRGRPRVLLTFDDGWVDNLNVALPHLGRISAKACFFVVTSLAGCDRPFWPERAVSLLRQVQATGYYEPLRNLLAILSARGLRSIPITCTEDECLTWLKQFNTALLNEHLDKALSSMNRECARRARYPLLPCDACRLTQTPAPFRQGDPGDFRERLLEQSQWRTLMEAGHTLGSHSSTHALLDTLGPMQLSDQLTHSRDCLRGTLPEAQEGLWISYPNGKVNESVARNAAASGYALGFLNTPGHWQSGLNQMLIPRINLWNGSLTDSNGNFSEEHLNYTLYWRPQHERPYV